MYIQAMGAGILEERRRPSYFCWGQRSRDSLGQMEAREYPRWHLVGAGLPGVTEVPLGGRLVLFSPVSSGLHHLSFSSFHARCACPVLLSAVFYYAVLIISFL